MNASILLSAFTASLILAGCNVESSPAKWQHKVSGVDGHYQATLSCETPPTTDSFQDCQIAFTTMDGDTAKLKMVEIAGGMPAHGHGLPTSPIMQAQHHNPGTYRIDGLKYNMPGAWLLGFKVAGKNGSDKIVFDFVI